ncbi:MAG: hypothetical protein WAU24_09010, partial [Chitinophagaceae bacterium]
AIDTIKNKKFDLIFLDIRFGEADHKAIDIHKMSGYKILTDEMRSSFKSLNFSTPVIVFTASNKVWNIIEMIEAGAVRWPNFHGHKIPINLHNLWKVNLSKQVVASTTPSLKKKSLK